MSSESTQPPIIPPPWFVEGLNAGVARDWCGDDQPPHRTALDPLVMLAWHLATESRPNPLVITGI